jgi:murein L,D-transpeptidase YafK
VNRSPIIRALLAMTALSAAVVLSGCNTDGALPMSERAARPLPEKLVQEIESKNMDREAPILVRIFKEEAELEVWKQERTGRYALLKTYPICRWSGELGPKIKEGDRQAPEGFYNITPGQMNPNSQYYLSFDLGYPNKFDRAHGRTGSQLMVHGDCSSRGCYSMTDEQISEIYALGRDAFFGGQKSFQVQAYPFRMTPQNFAKHRTNPNIAFWRMLKKGNDHFEVTRLEPKVDVCEKHYVFDAEPPANSTRQLSFNANGRCPTFQVPEDIANAVRSKEQEDNLKTAELIRRGAPLAPIRTNADGGMHSVFVAAVKRHEIGVPPNRFLLSPAPGTIPATVRPPRIPELADTPVATSGAPLPASEPQTRMAIAEPETQTAKPSASGGLFGNLFASKPAAAPASSSGNPSNRMANLVGRSSSKSNGNAHNEARKPPQTKRAAVIPEPKPAARKSQSAANAAPHGAIRPKPANKPEPQPSQSAETPPRARSPWPAVASPTTAQPQPSANTAMNGATPVVPAGSFENRWSAFR